MKKTPLRKVSKKQAEKNALWVKVKQERIRLLVNKYGYLICEYCNKPISEADGHHRDKNRRVNALENCAIVDRLCHTFITDHNIKDVPDLLKTHEPASYNEVE